MRCGWAKGATLVLEEHARRITAQAMCGARGRFKARLPVYSPASANRVLVDLLARQILDWLVITDNTL